MTKKNPPRIQKYIQKQPTDMIIENYLNKQFYLYEIDNNLEILQKVKIPKKIFKDFVRSFYRWEFDVFMPFRLNRDDLDFFKSQIGFEKLDVDTCVDVFLNVKYISISFDKNQIYTKDISFRELQNFSHLIPKEFFPDCRERVEELKIISRILKKEDLKKVYFIGKGFNLDLEFEDDYERIAIKESIYPELINEFSYVYKPTIDDINYLIKNNIIRDDIINKNYKEIILGYQSPQYSKLKDINIILQYDGYFEIHHLNNIQRKLLAKYFYKPLPSDHFYLGVLQVSENSFIIPAPKVYLLVRNEGGYVIKIVFFPSKFNLNELIKIFGIRKTTKVITSDEFFCPNEKQLIKISKIIESDILFDSSYDYLVGVTY